MSLSDYMDRTLQSHTRGDHRAYDGHRWQMSMHVDSCHSFSSSYRCTVCGAGMSTYGERDFEADPYSAIWMNDGVYDGEDGPCQRCAELRDGDEPAWRIYYLGAGNGASH